MKRNFLLNRSLFLLFGIILILPVFGINASPESTDFEVNPSNYSINVNIGDSRLYVFRQIRSSSFDLYDMMTEENEITLELEFGGSTGNLTINEGTKVRVEVVNITDTYIEIASTYYLLDGPVYYPNNTFINRSRLDLNSGFGPRFIMTTNDSLINQVYDGMPEWNKEMNPDFLRFSRSNWTDSFGYSEDYEYDGYDRFLRHLSIHDSYEGGYTDIELSSTYEINPDDYTLGVATGDSQFYTLRTIQFYDWGQGTYFNDIPITVKQGESFFHHSLKEGDRIYIEVTNTSGNYVKFSTKYYPQVGPEINDDTVHIMDKTSGYFSLNRILHGPPILMTINTSLINQYAPFEVDITADEMKYTSSWEDTTGFKQTETGSWNITTGWLNHYWRQEIEAGVVRYEFEIIAGSLTPEFAVGVKVGDSNTLRFTDILMMNGDSTSEIFEIRTTVEGVEQNLTLEVGDTVEIVVKEIEGFNITVYMKFHSSADGDVTSDSFTVNIAKLDGTNSNGPMFIIPTDPKIIDDMFKDKADVSYVGDNVYVYSEYLEDGKTYISEYSFNITTGWVIRMSQTTKVDGAVVETFSAESVGTTISPDDSTTNPSLTPVPLWPSIFFLIIAASFYRRKR